MKCTFQNLESQRGSCICKESDEFYNLLVEQSSFNTCTSILSGGAIFFGNVGQCVLSYVCGVKCNTAIGLFYGQFCYIRISNTENNKNFIKDSSVTLIRQTGGYAPLNHREGKFSCKGLNTSYSEVCQFSGLRVWDSQESFISFSSFRNNSALSNVCIENYGLGDHKMENTNIIENTELNILQGIIDVDGQAKLFMTHCSVFGNSPSNSVFSQTAGFIYCDDCCIPLDQKGNFNLIQLPLTTFINYYKFLELDSCKAGLDVWGHITPIIPTPEITIPLHYNKQIKIIM